MKTGHWFCLTCDDIVNLPATMENPLYPVCHRRTVQWIGTTDIPTPKETPVTDADAAKGFAQVRAAIAAATD